MKITRVWSSLLSNKQSYALKLFEFDRERGIRKARGTKRDTNGTKFRFRAFRSASTRGAAITTVDVLGSREREFRPVRRICCRLVFVIHVKRAPRRENEGVALTSLVLIKVFLREC